MKKPTCLFRGALSGVFPIRGGGGGEWGKWDLREERQNEIWEGV